MRAIRFLSVPVLALLTTALLQAWTMSVEFPFAALPRPVWDRDLAQLKEMGVTHVSLPRTSDATQLTEVIRIVRTLGLDADLEGPIPDRLQPLAKSHGGPLTEALPSAIRISAIMPRALDNERKLLTSGTQAIVWTDVFETLGLDAPAPSYHAGAITLAGAEEAGASLVRREAQLARFWGSTLSSLPEVTGARLSVPIDSVSVRQFIAGKAAAAASDPTPAGLSVTSVTNDSADAWKGELRVMYPAMQRPIILPDVAVAPHDVLWLPVNVPLTAGPLCLGCTGFAPPDHLIYATAELTDMEYENGVLALEFIAGSPGEAILQLSHEPAGPLIAAGRPSVFDWDPKTLRARLPIPAGNAKTGRVRVALAIDAPQATAFFQNTPVLLIGETNPLTAEFAPPAVAARSRLRATSGLTVSQEQPAAPPASQVQTEEDKKKPVVVTYKVAVPGAAIAGDMAQLAIEADGAQLSHAEARLLPPAAFSFEDEVSVRVAARSFVPLVPATIPVNQRSGREIVVTLRNNAPEIRTFDVEFSVPGLDFSPKKLSVSVGASVARDVSFRVFSSSADPGVHEGGIRLSGGATLTEPVRFVVLPPTGTVAWSAEGFSILESTKTRASFLAGQWLELIDKDSGADSQPPGGTAFHGGSVESLKLEDLIKLAAPASAH
jgi:hypothetical protein